MRNILSITGIVFGLTLLVVFSEGASASHRDEMDLYLVTHRWSSVTSTGLGKTARISSETLVGPAFGLRLHRHLQLNTEVLFGSPDASVTPGPITQADVVYVNVGLDYYIKHVKATCGSLAPYITGGVGAMNLDQDAAGGLNEWPFTYNAGVGLRWNMPGNTFLKFHYRWIWSELEVTDQTELFDGYGLSFGFNF